MIEKSRCMEKDIIIIGSGGHAKVLVDTIEQMNGFKIRGFLDDNIIGSGYKEYLILDKISNAKKYNNKNTQFIIAIGDNEIRKYISKKNESLKYAKLIHKSAIVSNSCTIGEGTVILAGSVINSESSIGRHVIINSKSIVEHDCIIGDYCHISPGCVICGGNIMNETVHVGANSVVIPNKIINKNSVIGAGSTVVKNIQKNVIVAGSPAEYIKDKKRRVNNE